MKALDCGRLGAAVCTGAGTQRLAALVDIVCDLVGVGLPVRPAAAALLREVGSASLQLFVLQPGDWARPVDDRDMWARPLPWVEPGAAASRLVALRLWPLWAELAESVADLEQGPAARLALHEADAVVVVRNIAATLAPAHAAMCSGLVRFKGSTLPGPDQLAAEYRELSAAPATSRRPIAALAAQYGVNRATVQRHLAKARDQPAAAAAPRVRSAWHPAFDVDPG